MNALEKAPGVLRKSSRAFVVWEDVALLLGCKRSKAYGIVCEVNEESKRRGHHAFPAGRANKYLFSTLFDIPIEDVDKVINGE